MTTEKTTKMTNKAALEYVLANCTLPEDVQEKIENQLNSLNKKSSSKSSKSVETAERAKIIMEYIAANPAMKPVSEWQKEIPELSPTVITNQKATQAFRMLLDNGQIIRKEIKGRAWYGIETEE